MCVRAHVRNGRLLSCLIIVCITALATTRHTSDFQRTEKQKKAIPRVPSLGFEYDPEYLESIPNLSPTALFGKFPGCGSLPLVLQV
jgi:hypothetical protein